MEYWCSLGLLLVVSTLQYSFANRPETDKLGFLVSETPIRYATTLNTTYFYLAVEINFDQTLVNTSRIAIEGILKEWQTYPVFVTDPDFEAPYVSLMQRAIQNLMEAYTYQDAILRYVMTDKIHPLSSICNFTVTELTQDELIRMIFNIKEAWSQVTSNNLYSRIFPSARSRISSVFLAHHLPLQGPPPVEAAEDEDGALTTTRSLVAGLGGRPLVGGTAGTTGAFPR
jgi:hypothetical protein